jgi:hypothetical protein
MLVLGLGLKTKIFGLGLESQVLGLDLASSGLGLDVAGIYLTSPVAPIPGGQGGQRTPHFFGQGVKPLCLTPHFLLCLFQ